MFTKIINSIKKIFSEPVQNEIYYKQLLDFFESKKIEFEEKYEEKINLEIKNIKTKLRAFNKDLMALSQKDPDSKLPQVTQDKIKDSIIDFVSEAKKLIKKINVNEEENTKFLEIVKNSDLTIKEYENQIKEEKDFLDDFFKNEIQDIEESLQDLKTHLETLQKRFKAQQSNSIEELENKIKEFLESNNQSLELEQRIQKIKENLKKIEELKESFLDKIEDLKGSPDYGKFHETVNKRKIVLDKISEAKEIFEHDFSKIKSAIKLYNIKNYRKILKKYLDDPFNALLEDEGEKFADLLGDVKRKIELDEIKLSTDNKRNAIQTIQKLNQTYLFEIVNEYQEAKNEKVRHDKVLSTNKVMSDYSELEYKIDHINKKIKAQKEVLKEVNLEVNANNQNALIAQIEKLFDNIFNTTIMISFEEKNEFEEDNE